MDLQIQEMPPCTYRQAQEARDELMWKKLRNISLRSVVNTWLDTLSGHTRDAYMYGLGVLDQYNVIDLDVSMQTFSVKSHTNVLYKISKLPFSPATKQARAACYISLTRYLHRITEGIIKMALPVRDGPSRTFFKLREKIKTKALTPSQWKPFLETIRASRPREYLICCLLLQGGKRISEVLNIDFEDIDFLERQITFRQAKTRGLEKYTIITFPQHLMDDLKEYLGCRLAGPVFLTMNKTRLSPLLALQNIKMEGIKFGLNLTTHMFRASCVTYLKKKGYADSEIQKITGHSSSEQVREYDKNEIQDNITRHLDLIKVDFEYDKIPDRYPSP